MSIHLLPDEILLKVFSYLGLGDKKCLGLTCRRLYNIYLDSQIHQDVVFVIRDKLHSAFDMLKSSQLSVYRLSLHNSELNGIFLQNWLDVWKKIVKTLTHLIVYNCDVRERALTDVLHLCSNLRVLHLVGCDSVFMSGILLQSTENMGSVTPVLVNLKELNLDNNRYLSDCLFFRLVTIAPNIEKLSLSSCQISFHPAIFKRFYPKFWLDPNSEHVLTFQRVLMFIAKRGTHFKSLDVSHTVIDSESLINLSSLHHLALEELYVSYCDQLTPYGFIRLSQLQKKLKCLDVSYCTRFNDTALGNVCGNLKDLECIQLKFCREITNIGLSELKHLQKLKTLNVGSCENITTDALIEVLDENGFRQLSNLSLRACYLSEMMLFTLLSNLPALRYLDLSSCGEMITDAVIQCIIKNLNLLEHLDVGWCIKVSDAGLGNIIQSHDDATPVVPESSLLPIKLLRGLKHLNLCSCLNVGNLSASVFDFNELIYLNLSLCRILSDDSAIVIGRNARSLETVLLSQCHTLTDFGVSKMIEHLPRLKYLDLQGCTGLTDECIKHFPIYLRELQHLDISFCLGITQDGIDSVEKRMHSLHTVHKRHITPSSGML